MYCSALERGCARDRGRGGPMLLQRGQQCARCVPTVDPVEAAAAAAARVVAPGTVCDGGNRLRMLTLAECVAYARRAKLDFLGSQRELSESPGCIRWATKMVEFNDHSDQGRGCNLGGKGRCVCTTTELTRGVTLRPGINGTVSERPLPDV